MTTPVAFFYQKPVVLQFDAHKDLRFTPTGTVEFAAQQTIVPLVLAEFGEASLEYPVVFVKSNDGQWLAAALTGLEREKNVFVTHAGKWDARYVPAALRRYPFVLAKTGDDQFSVAADLDAPHFAKKTGEPIFADDGSPSAFMKEMLALLQDFQAQAERTSDLLRRLESEGLLEQTPVSLQTPQGQAVQIGSIWMVSEQKLLKAPDKFLLTLAKSGEMGFLYAHLLSVRKLGDLLNKAQSAREPKPAAKAAASSASPAKSATKSAPEAKRRTLSVPEKRKPAKKGRA